MATAKITVDEGTTTNTATYTITEDAVTKHIPRAVISKSDGTELGTPTNPFNVSGTVTGNIASGTINSVANLAAGTVTSLQDGTLGLVTRVGNVGTLEAGTITTLPNIPGGTVNSIGNLVGGTITSLQGGTVQTNTLSGTITSVQGGSIAVIAGTMNTGTINAGTINSGTFVANGGTIAQLTNGSIAMTTGTINAGTINSGTFRMDGRTTQNILTYGTQFAFSAGTAGTVVGSASVGAGTFLWVSDLSIMNPSGSVLCVLGFGTAQQGTNVLFRGVLGTQTGVGIEKSYSRLVNAGMTNQDLVFSTGGAGTVDVAVSYLISV